MKKNPKASKKKAIGAKKATPKTATKKGTTKKAAEKSIVSKKTSKSRTTKTTTKKSVSSGKGRQNTIAAKRAKPGKSKGAESTAVKKTGSATRKTVKKATTTAKDRTASKGGKIDSATSRKSGSATATKKAAARKASTRTASGEDKRATQERTAMRYKIRSRKKTPAVFKLPSKKHTPIVFSLEDVQEVIRARPKDTATKAKKKGTRKKQEDLNPENVSNVRGGKTLEPPMQHRRLGAASLTDILGYNPQGKITTSLSRSEKVPREYQRYYRKLINLRNHVKSGLDLHTQDTLKRSSKEDSGDLSAYSQHMADAGTENFDRDFALSLVSNEQEALLEIESAIDRIFDGTYGVCEITGKAIKRERLEAVPFTRFSVEGQKEYESSNRKRINRHGVLLDTSDDSTPPLTDEDADE